MREWSLKKGSFPAMTLAADARLGRLNYYDDQIWGLTVRGGEPAALALQTSYGLRARNMRMFARFTENDIAVSNPVEFHAEPIIHRFYPNYLLGTYSPFEGLDVVFEYWVPESAAIAGRLRIINSGVTPRELQIEWVALLNPTAAGHRMTPALQEQAHILEGSLDGLSPIIFMTGGPEARSSPHPSLATNLKLRPGLDHKISWVHAAKPDSSESFSLAREIAAKNWDGEFAKIELLNESQIDITTGNPSWDLAFALGQKTALNLLHGPTEHLRHISPVMTRHPDQGYSQQGDGQDYDHLWNGQTPLDVWYLASQIPFSSAGLLQGMANNFLDTQTENGHIDWKPGLSGKRSGRLATPILCHLIWQIYQKTEDETFLQESFPKLLNFINHWFSGSNDRDGDGVPEWDHPLQSGFEDNPLFAWWHSWALAIDITYFESPVLLALLHRECMTLIKIANQVDNPTPISDLMTTVKHLEEALQKTWNNRQVTYHYIDRDSHTTPEGQMLGFRVGPGGFSLAEVSFQQAARLLVSVQKGGETVTNLQIKIEGMDQYGKEMVEEIKAHQFRWTLGKGVAVSQTTFSAVSSISVEESGPLDEITAQTVDMTSHDHTLFLPLWTGIPSEKKGKEIIRAHLINPARYGKPYGIPALPSSPHPEAEVIGDSVWMIWNSLIGFGLLRYGERAFASEIVARLMDSVCGQLEQNGNFRRHYRAQSGEGIGENNILNGLPPLGLFLETLGVRLFSPWKVRLEGKNPFPWPIKIQASGLFIERGLEMTRITFPNGETVDVTDPAPTIIDGRTQ